MPQVTRARQRAAIAALLASVSGIDATYDYAPDPDSPELEGKTYAVCGGAPHSTLKGIAGNSLAPYEQQQRGWLVMVASRSGALGAQNNAGRQAAIESFDTVLDAVEKKLWSTSKLTDGAGVVALKFGDDIETIEVAPELGEDRTLMVGVFIVNGYVIQSA